jgi:hypothetical protein
MKALREFFLQLWCGMRLAKLAALLARLGLGKRKEDANG